MPLDAQLLARVTVHDRACLYEVADSLEQASRAWNQISAPTQCELNAMHHDEGSLALCLRQALQAAEELIAATASADGCPV